MAAVSEAGGSVTKTRNVYYTVVSGDTLSTIAARATKYYKQTITWQSIANWNGIKSPYTIKKGQKLKFVIKYTGTIATGGNGGTTSSGYDTGSASAMPGQMLDKVIGGAILYGIYKTFQKIF